MFEKCARWLLPVLLLAAFATQAQRPATLKTTTRRPTLRAKAVRPVLETEKALVISVRDTSNGRFVVPQVVLRNAAVAARINLGLADAALGEDLEMVPEPLTARAAIEQAHAELAAKGPVDQQGFVEARYEVLYNNHGLLSVEFTSEYLGAYPSSVKRHATFDLRTGHLLQVRDLVADTLALRQRWQQFITRRVAGHLRTLPTEYPQADAELLADVRRRLYWNDSTAAVQLEAEEPRFYDFALTPLGLVLYYDFGFPHVMEALQPDPDYLFPYADLKLWLKPKWLLAFRR